MLKNCPQCGQQMSITPLARCPKCGYLNPITRHVSGFTILCIIGGIAAFFALAFIALLYG